MPKPLTSAQRQYIETLLLSGQRAEFSERSESFWLYSPVEVNAQQFARLSFSIFSVKPSLRYGEFAVQFAAS